jgi:ribonuclease-3
VANWVKRSLHRLRPRSLTDRQLAASIRTIVGVSPANLKVYQLALKHKSMATVEPNGFRSSNERLEYLGDAILGAVVADYLFRKYPFEQEGFLTEIRSRIVNRESLNNLGRQLGLEGLVRFDSKLRKESYRTIFGNALEALIGALYLDWGYRITADFIENRILHSYIDLEHLVVTPHNYKSLLIEWAQKNNKKVSFEITGHEDSQIHDFTAELYLGQELIATGRGSSKKKAEKDASRKAWEKLGLDTD